MIWSCAIRSKPIRSADVAVARPEASLADVDMLRNELPVTAGAGPQAWDDAFARLGPDLSCGRITMAQGFEQILAACRIGRGPRWCVT